MTLWDTLNRLRNHVDYGNVSIAWDDEVRTDLHLLFIISQMASGTESSDVNRTGSTQIPHPLVHFYCLLYATPL